MVDAHTRPRNTAARFRQKAGRGTGSKAVTRRLEGIIGSGRVFARAAVVLPRPVLLGADAPDVRESEKPTTRSFLRSISVSCRDEGFGRAEVGANIRCD